MPSYKDTLTPDELIDLVAYVVIAEGNAPVIAAARRRCLASAWRRSHRIGSSARRRGTQNWLTYSGAYSGQRYSR